MTAKVVTQILHGTLVKQIEYCFENFAEKMFKLCLKGFIVDTSNCNADDWNSVSTEQRFDLFEKDGSGDLSNDVGDKHDVDKYDNGFSDNTLCNILIN